jgi:SAM-dependent methyltransferase
VNGIIDVCTNRYASGWAVNDAGEPARLAIEVDGERIVELTADRQRPDLPTSCAFRYVFADSLADSEVVRVVEVDTGRDLRNSPASPSQQGRRGRPVVRTDWAELVTLPPVQQMMRIGSEDQRVFVAQGSRIATLLGAEMRSYFGDITPEMKILDFGCGVGRALLPLALSNPGVWHGCDVDESAVGYLRGAVPAVKAEVTGYQPPLPYESESFDCVYSISIWTHLPIGLQLPWLKEIRRILRPDGLALISTSGPAIADVRRTRGDLGWEEVTAEDIVRSGVVYREYPRQGLPGITGSYGLSAHDPAWIERVWGQVLTHLTHRPAAVEGTQDLHLMTRL